MRVKNWTCQKCGRPCKRDRLPWDSFQKYTHIRVWREANEPNEQFVRQRFTLQPTNLCGVCEVDLCA